MIDYDFLDMDDDKDYKGFDYSGFYSAQSVAVLPTPTITDCRTATRINRINPFTTRIGKSMKQILKLRRRMIAELRIRTNRYYKEA